MLTPLDNREDSGPEDSGQTGNADYEEDSKPKAKDPPPSQPAPAPARGQQTGATADQALDVVITNALIVDACLGIVKADVGIKGTSIVGIGKAGNPDLMDSVDMIVGNTTEVIAGEKLILTAGGIDTHIHWICPQQIEEAIASGVTSMFGGGTGPVRVLCGCRATETIS